MGVLGDAITYIFIGIILCKVCILCINNGMVYRQISKKGKELDEEVSRALPKELINILDVYISNNPYGVINTQTLVEEYIGTISSNPPNKIIQKNKSTSSQVIILGVLGTFIGLVRGLKGINFQDTQAVQTLLEGMHIAFWTSITGIIASLFIQWVLSRWDSENILTVYMIRLEMLLNNKLESKKDREIGSQMILINRQLEKISGGLEALYKLDDAAHELTQFNVGFGENIAHLINGLTQSATMMKDFSGNIMTLSNKLDILNDAFYQHTESNQLVMQAVQQATQHMKETVYIQQELKDNINEMLAEHTNTLADIQKQIIVGIHTAENIQNLQEQHIHDYQVSLKNMNDTILGCVEDWFDKMNNQQEITFNTVGNILNETVSKQNTIAEGMITSITQTHIQLEEIQESHLKNITLIDENFKETHDMINHLVSTYSDIYIQQEDLVLQVKKVVESILSSTKKMEEGIGINLHNNERILEKHIDITKQVINSELKALSNAHLTDQFIKAYSYIKTKRDA